MILHTERLVLRGARQADLDALFEIQSDPRAMQYWSVAPHADRSVTQERLDRLIARFAVAPVYFVLERNGAVIGTAGMMLPNEVGFILHPDHWRQGLVREAMQTIIPYLFKTTDVAELIADADPNNAASVGLLQSLGFHETHRAKNTFCINGVWSDSVYFALPRPGNSG